MFDVSGLWVALKSLTYGYEGENTTQNEWIWVKDPMADYCPDPSLLAEEIDNVRQNGKRIRARNIIRAHCQGLIYKLSPEDRLTLEQVCLPCDVLSSLVREYVSVFGDDWKEYLIERYDIEDFKTNWESTEYSKGVTGHLISLASCAANDTSVNGLTERQLCDIIWSLRVSLKNMIEIELGRLLTGRELIQLTERIMNTAVGYLELHLLTAKNIGQTTDSYGVLPARWTQEKEAEEARLLQLKQDGKVDFGYHKSVDDFSYSIDMKARAESLDRVLFDSSKVDCSYHTPINQFGYSVDMKTRCRQVEQILMERLGLASEPVVVETIVDFKQARQALGDFFNR